MKAQAGNYERRAETRRMLRRWGGSERYLREMTTQLNESRLRMLDARETLHATQLDDMPKGGSIPRDLSDVLAHMEAVAARFAADSARIDAEVQSTMQLRARVDAALTALPDIESRVIRLRYGRRFGWVRIGCELGVTEGQARRVERRAVDMIGKQIDKAA